MIIKATSVYICHNTHKDKNHFMIHVADIIGTNLTQYILIFLSGTTNLCQRLFEVDWLFSVLFSLVARAIETRFKMDEFFVDPRRFGT